jgi:cytochrome c-type biogenesis protein CcmH/NrfG
MATASAYLPWLESDDARLFMLQSTKRLRQYNDKTLQLMESVLRKDHPDTLAIMNNLAISLDQQGKYAEAETTRWSNLSAVSTECTPICDRDHVYLLP